jgi:hypothetical protein
MNVAQDKINHIKYTAGMALLLSLATNPTLSAGITLFVWGFGKEIVYDKWMGKGTPEWMDFVADIMGTVIGCGGAICIKYLIQ